MIPKLITVEWLTERGACHSQVVRFGAKWPDGAEPTEANLLRAVELGLDLSWLAHQLPGRLRSKYQRQGAPLFTEFHRQGARLWAEDDRQLALLRAEYERREAPLLARLIAQAAEGG